MADSKFTFSKSLTDIVMSLTRITDTVEQIREQCDRNTVLMERKTQLIAHNKQVVTRIQRRMGAMQQNHVARAHNATCESLDDEIMPIPLATGEFPENFPQTRRQLNELSCPAVSALLEAYGMPIFGHVSRRRTLLSDFVGLPDLRAPV